MQEGWLWVLREQFVVTCKSGESVALGATAFSFNSYSMTFGLWTLIGTCQGLTAERLLSTQSEV